MNVCVGFECNALRERLFRERAFRLTPAQRRRFSIQAQYDANETFRNLFQWTGTTLEVTKKYTLQPGKTSNGPSVSVYLLETDHMDFFVHPFCWIFHHARASNELSGRLQSCELRI